MKKRFLAFITAIIISNTSIPVLGMPNNSDLDASRNKYTEIENKITDIQNKIYDLSYQMEPLQADVDKNKQQIQEINKTTEDTKKDIIQCKKDINDLDIALGKRVKEFYISGNSEFNYLNFIVNSDSTTEFFSRVQAVASIVGKDKAYIGSINNKKDQLNDKIKSLDSKKKDISKLNKESQEKLNQLSVKKKAEQVLSNEINVEKNKFDSQYLSKLEMNAVKSQFDIIDSSTSSSGEIEAAVGQLSNMKSNQIKSPIVIKTIDTEIEKGKIEAAKKKVSEKTKAGEQKSSVSNNSSLSPDLAGKAEAVLNEAYKHLGVPYVWGATGPDTFDCSGFTQYVYQHAVGIDITRTTYTQIDQGQAVSEDELQPGDLVFPHTGHVGIYVGNGQMIHAPQTGDVVKVTPIYKFYAGRRIL